MKIPQFRSVNFYYFAIVYKVWIHTLTIMYFCKMQLLKRIFSFYIFSNFHVAVAGFFATLITIQKYDSKNSVTAAFVFLSIVISYNFIRFYEIKTLQLKWLSNWMLHYKNKLIAICICCFLIMFYLLFFTNFRINSIWVLLPFGIITLFYAVPIYKTKNIEISFRNFPFIKIFSIAFTWAGITVFLPIYESDTAINNDIFLEFLQRFVLTISITIPFDIRDIKIDFKKLKTLPQTVGIVKSKLLGTCLMGIFIILEFLKTANYFYPISSFLISIIVIGFLWNSSEKKSKFYTRFWVESVPVFWWFLIAFDC